MYRWGMVTAASLLLGGQTTARAASEIVVAMRYLQPRGVSHAGLYLYREDGKLLRKLTRGGTGQDVLPVFSPDGTEIVFTRRIARGAIQYWTIQPRGGGLRRVKAPPAWYTAGIRGGLGPLARIGDMVNADLRFRSPDGAFELAAAAPPASPNGDSGGPIWTLKDMKSGQEKRLGALAGVGPAFTVPAAPEGRSFWRLDGKLRVAFLGTHLNSTDGDTVYGVDLPRARLVALSTNWAVPYPLAGEGAFLTVGEYRYVPIRGSRMTANCAYVEHWDAKLHRIRYGTNEAGICYGASMYRPSLTPRVVNVPSGEWFSRR